MLGCGGHGKTTQLLELLKAEKSERFFVYDHKHEIGRRMGKPYVYTLNGLVEATAKGGWIVFDPCHLYPGQKQAGLQFFLDFIYTISEKLPGRKIVVIDEIHRFMSRQSVPEEMLLIVDDGRNFKIDLFACGQASNSINNEVRHQITECWAFRHSDKNGLAWLAENGFDPEEIVRLKPGEFVWRDLANGETQRGGKAFRIKSPRSANVRPIAKRRDDEKRGGQAANQRADS